MGKKPSGARRNETNLSNEYDVLLLLSETASHSSFSLSRFPCFHLTRQAFHRCDVARFHAHIPKKKQRARSCCHGSVVIILKWFMYTRIFNEKKSKLKEKEKL